MPADSAQHRRDVEQLVRNVYPDCHPVFVPDERGALAFRIQDEHGRFGSGFVKVYDWHRQRFTKSWLLRAVRLASTPEPGFPRLPTGG
jgi:hypothetical protein